MPRDMIARHFFCLDGVEKFVIGDIFSLHRATLAQLVERRYRKP